MKRTMLRRVQLLAKSHKASGSVPSLSKNPGPLTPCPMLPEALSHYGDSKRILIKCLLVNSLSQGKVILKQSLKHSHMIFRRYRVEFGSDFRNSLKLPSETMLVLPNSKRQFQPYLLVGPISCQVSPCVKGKISNSHTFDNTKKRIVQMSEGVTELK